MSLNSFLKAVAAFVSGNLQEGHLVPAITYGTNQYWFSWTSHDDGEDKTHEFYKRTWMEPGRNGWDVYDNAINPNSEIRKAFIDSGVVSESLHVVDLSVSYEEALTYLKRAEEIYEAQITTPVEGMSFLRKEPVRDHFTTAPAKAPRIKAMQLQF